MLKNYRIKKLQIEIAKLATEVEVLERLIIGTTKVPSYYADKFIDQSGKLAEMKKRLELIGGEEKDKECTG